MLFSREAPAGFVALLAVSWPSLVKALDIDYCASFNTANLEAFTSNLQTNGLCLDHCKENYAFSITQRFNCWCSNFAPASSIQVSRSQCDFPCPAYPDEDCGGDTVFGYIQLSNNNVNDILPSGTRGAPSSSSTRSTSSTTSEAAQTTEEAAETTTSEESTTTSRSTTSESSTSESSTEPASTAVRTVTAGGTIKTVFVGPTDAAGDSDSDSSNGEPMEGDGSGGGGNGLGKGALAGIIVGVALGVIAVIGAGLFLYFRRRRNQQQQEDYQEDPSIRGSSSGMMGGGQRPEMATSGGSPSSPNSNSNRNSTLMIDPRMDPFKQGLYIRNGSHESINTLRDDHDYSRKIQQRTLRATNPDPDDNQ